MRVLTQRDGLGGNSVTVGVVSFKGRTLDLSSHGTQEGLTCGGKTIGAEVIAESIRDAGNLRLLHFGSCLIAAGDIPRKIHATLGPNATFPISGYTRTADWGEIWVDEKVPPGVAAGPAGGRRGLSGRVEARGQGEHHGEHDGEAPDPEEPAD